MDTCRHSTHKTQEHTGKHTTHTHRHGHTCITHKHKDTMGTYTDIKTQVHRDMRVCTHAQKKTRQGGRKRENIHNPDGRSLSAKLSLAKGCLPPPLSMSRIRNTENKKFPSAALDLAHKSSCIVQLLPWPAQLSSPHLSLSVVSLEKERPAYS